MPASAEEGDQAQASEHTSQQIAKRAGIVGLGTLASRALGLGRDQVLAAVYTTAQTDAFWIAFTIPNLLRQLVAEGAVQNAVIPVLAEVREKQGEAQARAFFRSVRGLSALVLLALTLLGIWFAPELVGLFAGGFRSSPQQFERTVTLTRLLFPYLLTIGTVALGVAALNTYRRFIVTSFAPGLLNLAFIAAALGLSGVLAAHGYDPILSMAFGALTGGLLQMLAQWPSLSKIGYASAPRLDLRDPNLREVVRRMAPVSVGLGIYYVDVIVGRRLLSELGEGPVSYFNYALRLCDFPQGIFIMALQAATLPSLAALVAKRDLAGASATFAQGMRLSLFVGLGASFMLVALAEPLVVLLFQRGQFTAEQAQQTAFALMAQGAAVWVVASIRQLVAVFYATGDTRTPVVISGVDLCVFVAVALLLVRPLGHVGISLAVSCSAFAQMSLLWYKARTRLPELHGRKILASALHTAFCALVAAVVSFAVAWLLTQASDGSALARALPGLLGALCYLSVFLGTAYFSKSQELHAILEPLRRRKRRHA